MSVGETLQDLDIPPDELAEAVTRRTIPGPSNRPYLQGLVKATGVVDEVIEDLNNWFYVVDIRIHGENHVAIPMRYRWTIIRWAKNDMDNWLMNNGWQDHAHLNADSRTREDNEMEARYRKEYGDVTVDCTFLVEWPEIVFEKMNDEDLERVKERKRKRKERKHSLDRIAKARRS